MAKGPGPEQGAAVRPLEGHRHHGIVLDKDGAGIPASVFLKMVEQAEDGPVSTAARFPPTYFDGPHPPLLII